MLYKKERDVNDLILKHLAKVEKCITTALKTVEEYLDNNIDEAKKLAKKVDQIETETDEIRREIISRLYSGAYLPLLREDILNLVQQLDNLANGSESCCDFFLDQRPEIPKEIKQNILKLMEDSVSSFTPLKEAVGPFFMDKIDTKTIREKTSEVGIIESAVDKQEWDITRDIFKTDLDYGHKIHLKLCLARISAISDRAEDAADMLEIIIIKGGL